MVGTACWSCAAASGLSASSYRRLGPCSDVSRETIPQRRDALWRQPPVVRAPWPLSERNRKHSRGEHHAVAIWQPVKVAGVLFTSGGASARDRSIQARSRRTAVELVHSDVSRETVRRPGITAAGAAVGGLLHEALQPLVHEEVCSRHGMPRGSLCGGVSRVPCSLGILCLLGPGSWAPEPRVSARPAWAARSLCPPVQGPIHDLRAWAGLAIAGFT